MFRGGSIATTLLFSICFNKMKAKRNQVAGSVLAIFGILIVGASSLIFAKGDSSSSDVVKFDLYRLYRLLGTY